MPAPAPAETSPGAGVRPAGSALTAAYTRMTEVLPSLGVTELAPGEPAPTGGGRIAVAGLAAGGADLDAYLTWAAEPATVDRARVT